MAYTPIDKGSVLFVGDYANVNTPLWLSALNPTASPANLTVSSLTVAPTGGVLITSDRVAFPDTKYGSIDFYRAYYGDQQLVMRPISNPPGQPAFKDYISVTQAGGTQYDDMAMKGLYVFGSQVTNPSANTGIAGYITQGSLPYSVNIVTGQLETATIHANIGSISSLTVSSINGGAGGGSASDPFLISSIRASTINAGSAYISSLSSVTGYISSLTANEMTTSTLNVSSFQLGNVLQVSSLNASTLSAVSANTQFISSGTISAGIGNFSTLNIAGGGGITNSTINTSSITTGLLSTTTGVIKEIFTSSMTFNATLSPNFDLGLGGIIGGMAGGFGANALSVGLGAANLATGLTALTLARQSGGLNSTIFQTVNGTSQLQFSTIGVSTTGVLYSQFVDTDSINPYQIPGNELVTTTVIPPGSYCMRTVSDPLNLPNTSGTTGLGIQSFSSWTPVYPGALQVKANSISSILTGNTISLGEAFGDGIFITPAPGKSIRLNALTTVSSMIVQGQLNATTLVAPTIQGTNGSLSTLTVSTFSIGTTAFNNINASTVTTSTLTVTGAATIDDATLTGTVTVPFQLNTLNVQVNNTLTAFNVVPTNITQPINGQLFTPRGTMSNLNVSSINGLPVPAGGNVLPTLTVTGQSILGSANSNIPVILAPVGGTVQVGGQSGNPNYEAIMNVLGNFKCGRLQSWSSASSQTSWMNPNPPIPVVGGPSPYQNPSGYMTLSGLNIMWGLVNNGNFPGLNFVPPFSGQPAVFVMPVRQFNLQVVACLQSTTASNASVAFTDLNGAGINAFAFWLAIGPQ